MSNETTAYRQCTNRQNSQTTKMTIGVPIVTCLHRLRVRVRRIHKALVKKANRLSYPQVLLYTSLVAQKEQQARKQTIKSNNKQTLTKQTGINT